MPAGKYLKWTDEDVAKFERLYKLYHKDFKLYVAHFPGRNKI